jgi:hypothetical protein
MDVALPPSYGTLRAMIALYVASNLVSCPAPANMDCSAVAPLLAINRALDLPPCNLYLFHSRLDRHLQYIEWTLQLH